MKCKIHKCTAEATTKLKVCSKHYGKLYNQAHSTKRVPKGTVCQKTTFCGKPAAKFFKTIEHGCIETGGFYCIDHHAEAVTELFGGQVNAVHRYVVNGYVILGDKKDHPLANSHGQVAEHRFVVYEDLGKECGPCYWCGVSLTWDLARIDHLDEDKSNNSRLNLVTSCNACNRARGALLPFVARMREDAIPTFFDQILRYRTKCQNFKKSD